MLLMHGTEQILQETRKLLILFFFFPDFQSGTSGKEPTCQYRRHKEHGFDPWIGKISWRRAWQLTPVFLPGESH